MAGPPGRSTRWRWAAGSALALVVLVGVIVLVRPPGSAQPIPAPTTSASPRSGRVLVPEPTSTVPPAIRYQGPVTVGTTGIDLDLPPPGDRAADDGDDVFFNYLDGALYPELGSAIARWTGGPAPSYGDCAARARTAPVDSLKLAVGDTVCAHTSEGRYVRLRVTALADRSAYTFDAVVWELF